MIGQTTAAQEALRVALDEQGLRRDQKIRETLADFSPDDLRELSWAAIQLARLCQILSREPR